MQRILRETHRGWTISVQAGQDKCANFSFAITDPSGRTQNVGMGGHNEQRALERAREMIDMELAFVIDN